MELERWFAELVGQAEDFRNQWLKSNSDNPQQYPMFMEPGDWDEQFTIWCDQQ